MPTTAGNCRHCEERLQRERTQCEKTACGKVENHFPQAGVEGKGTPREPESDKHPHIKEEEQEPVKKVLQGQSTGSGAGLLKWTGNKTGENNSNQDWMGERRSRRLGNGQNQLERLNCRGEEVRDREGWEGV